MNQIETTFYIVPHADDWQLFMQPNAFNDINSGKKVVIIIVTSGDAGFGEIFYKAREEGCLSSIRYCLAHSAGLYEKKGIKKINKYFISYYSINNVITYFLRLPDGNLDGTGFKANNYQSLFNLHEHNIDALFKLDHSECFKTWDDLSNLLYSIICVERKNELITINYLNPDINVNKNDHNDHICVGKILQGMEEIVNCSHALYQGYNVSEFAGSLTSDEMFWKVGIFSAYEKTVFDLTGYSTIRENPAKYSQWCSSKNNFIFMNNK